MARRTEQGILDHTMSARPFWASDVDITQRCPARRLPALPAQPSGGLGRTLQRMIAAIAGR